MVVAGPVIAAPAAPGVTGCIVGAAALTLMARGIIGAAAAPIVAQRVVGAPPAVIQLRLLPGQQAIVAAGGGESGSGEQGDDGGRAQDRLQGLHRNLLPASAWDASVAHDDL
jgi:hypothetical protein